MCAQPHTPMSNRLLKRRWIGGRQLRYQLRLKENHRSSNYSTRYKKVYIIVVLGRTRICDLFPPRFICIQVIAIYIHTYILYQSVRNSFSAYSPTKASRSFTHDSINVSSISCDILNEKIGIYCKCTYACI